jgi:hypothetical protein
VSASGTLSAGGGGGGGGGEFVEAGEPPFPPPQAEITASRKSEKIVLNVVVEAEYIRADPSLIARDRHSGIAAYDFLGPGERTVENREFRHFAGDSFAVAAAAALAKSCAS